MSKEKQIEIPEDEIGTSGYSKLAWKLWQELKLPMTQCETIDRIVRDEGYRKQSEGEWLPDMEWFDEEEGISKKAGFYQTGWKCSLCGRNEHKKEPYCNCGARMKGGE